MNLIWLVLLGLVAGGLLFLFALCKVAGDEDRAAHLEDERYLDQSAQVAAELMRIRLASATTPSSVSTFPARVPG